MTATAQDLTMRPSLGSSGEEPGGTHPQDHNRMGPPGFQARGWDPGGAGEVEGSPGGGEKEMGGRGGEKRAAGNNGGGNAWKRKRSRSETLRLTS